MGSIKKSVVEQRINHLKSMMYNAELNVKVFEVYVKEFNTDEDRKNLQKAEEELRRFKMALAVVEKELESE